MASSKGKGRRHAHLKKRPAQDKFTFRIAHKTCDACGKYCYLTRGEAKQSAKVNNPGQLMREYQCTEPSGKTWWHLSSVPADRLRRIREARE